MEGKWNVKTLGLFDDQSDLQGYTNVVVGRLLAFFTNMFPQEPRGRSAGTYPGFCRMKQLGVFLLPPGWDASKLQGHPKH